jgi:hypothetical protein
MLCHDGRDLLAAKAEFVWTLESGSLLPAEVQTALILFPGSNLG